MKKLLTKPEFRIWLAVVGASTLVLGAAYTIAQQSARLSADDLPLVAAQNAQKLLESGSEPGDVVPSLKTDLSNDASVFTIVTDNALHVLASSASLSGQTPLPPSGVFDYTKVHATDRITWQPQSGVRLATRVVTYSNGGASGFIVTGQSLKSAEDRIDTYGALAFSAWVALVAWTTFILLLPLPGGGKKR
jgi:hypothetical protein